MKGFSLVEIMVALAILSMSVLTVITLQNSSVRMSIYSKQSTIASMLARSVMVDAYLEYYAQSLTNAIKEEKSGEEEMAGLPMKWTTTLDEVPLEIPLEGGEEEEGDSQASTPDAFKPIIETLNDYLKNAMRELSVVVSWQSGAQEEKVHVVTHLIDFSHPLKIPSIKAAPLPAEGEE